jgi:hypothetical protein
MTTKRTYHESNAKGHTNIRRCIDHILSHNQPGGCHIR